MLASRIIPAKWKPLLGFENNRNLTKKSIYGMVSTSAESLQNKDFIFFVLVMVAKRFLLVIREPDIWRYKTLFYCSNCAMIAENTTKAVL